MFPDPRANDKKKKRTKKNCGTNFVNTLRKKASTV